MRILVRACAIVSAALFLYACMPTPPGPTSPRRSAASGAEDDAEEDHLDLGPTREDLRGADLAGEEEPAAPANNCGVVTAQGDCVAGSARRCEDGTLVREDCTAQGQICMSDAEGVYCGAPGGGGPPDDPPADDPPPATGVPTLGAACGALTNDGLCYGAVLRFCDTSTMKVAGWDCAAYGGCVVTAGFANCKTY